MIYTKYNTDNPRKSTLRAKFVAQSKYSKASVQLSYDPDFSLDLRGCCVIICVIPQLHSRIQRAELYQKIWSIVKSLPRLSKASRGKCTISSTMKDRAIAAVKYGSANAVKYQPCPSECRHVMECLRIRSEGMSNSRGVCGCNHRAVKLPVYEAPAVVGRCNKRKCRRSAPGILMRLCHRRSGSARSRISRGLDRDVAVGLRNEYSAAIGYLCSPNSVIAPANIPHRILVEV